MIQGSLCETKGHLDFAIVGDGFFKEKDEKNNRILYTRQGKFRIGGGGKIVTRKGYVVLSLQGMPFGQSDAREDWWNDLRFTVYTTKDPKNDIEWAGGAYYRIRHAMPVKKMRFLRGFIETSTTELSVILARMEIVGRELAVRNPAFQGRADIAHTLFKRSLSLEDDSGIR